MNSSDSNENKEDIRRFAGILKNEKEELTQIEEHISEDRRNNNGGFQ